MKRCYDRTLSIGMELLLRRLPREGERWCWLPCALTTAIYVMCFQGMAYSFFPYIVPDKLTIWQAASAPEAL